MESLRDRDRLWQLSQDLMLICDFEGEIVSVNPSATRLLGWATGDLVGHSISEFIHPHDMAATAAEVVKLSTGATTLAFENRYRASDGSYRLIDWTAVPDDDRIHAVGRDITDERRATRDRERIWSLSPVVKVVADTSGKIVAVNPSWTRTLGWCGSRDHRPQYHRIYRQERRGRRATGSIGCPKPTRASSNRKASWGRTTAMNATSRGRRCPRAACCTCSDATSPLRSKRPKRWRRPRRLCVRARRWRPSAS